ncbi:MAG: hypothetical protein ABH950_06735, partial [Candidatus Altiarchaeota archaeon]
CKEEGIGEEELRRGSRRGKLSMVRLRIARQLVKDFGLSLAEVARQLGVSTSAVSKMLVREISNSI